MNLDFDYKAIEAEESDYKNTDSRLLANMAFQIFLIREFENTLLKLSGDGCVHGPIHISIGEEACAAGAMAALEPTDKIVSTHRAHHHYLAKAIGYYSANGFDVTTDNVPNTVTEEVTTLLAEVMGLNIGCCGGRGGSMHLRNEKVGVVGTNAIVAGGVPMATGAAFALKYNKSKDIIVCFVGDGAVNQGSFHESLNLAGIWKLPVLYFIENNQYAVATSVKYAATTQDLAIRAAGYSLSARIVDGMDPTAVMLAVQDAVEYVRNGNGATVIEAKCYRFHHHAGDLPGSAFGYRTKEEEKQWQQKDPYTVFPKELIARSLISEKQIEQIQSKAIDTVKKAVEHCTIYENEKFFVKDDLWPKVESIETGLRSDGSEFKNAKFQEIEDFAEFQSLKYVDAIASVTGRWLEKDEKVFVLGEEIANFGGGPYGATKGLPAKYPDRVLNTPISESGFTGLAGGAAISGLKPIVEIMFPDFALVAADQLFNQIGKLRHIYGNTIDMPIVVRTRIAIGCGYGGQHSMDPVGLFSLFSGWWVVTPSNAFDYIGLFNSAMLCKDPVLIVEHHSLYPIEFKATKNNLDYMVQLSKAKVLKRGSDVTVLCYSSTVALAMQAANDLEADRISVEVIDLRTVSPADIDYETIGNSLKKTGVLVIAEQTPAGMSVSPHIITQCQKRFFDYLDHSIVALGSLDIPLPVSKKLEAAAVPTVKSIKDIIYKTISHCGTCSKQEYFSKVHKGNPR